MRPDMEKLLTECYRHGKDRDHRRKRIQDKQLPIEEAPIRESFSKWAVAHWQGKEQADNLAPLKRFLQRSVGKLWNDVYSEICQNINTNKATDIHILQHLDWMVEKNTFVGEDGKVWFYSSGGDPSPIEDRWAYSEQYYVCPKTGTLQKQGRKKTTYKHKPEVHKITISNDSQAFQIDGIWYIVTLRKRDDRDRRWSVVWAKFINKDDHILERIAKDNGIKVGSWEKMYQYKGMSNTEVLALKIYGDKDLISVKQKQMNSRELKRMKLKNAA